MVAENHVAYWNELRSSPQHPAGKYEKAAYVYLKLLKNYASAAETLRQGEHYEKAALIYLRYLKDERAAAECYEVGRVYDEAIPLYTKLEDWEKVGDLHLLQGNEPSAHSAYHRHLDRELDRRAFLSAARLSQEKWGTCRWPRKSCFWDGTKTSMPTIACGTT